MSTTIFSKDEFKNYILIIIGSITLAFSVVGFFSPNQLITGGTAGLALLLHYITPLSIGSLILLINFPLLMIGGKFLGKSFAIRTIVTLIFISLFIDLFDKVFEIQPFIIDTPLGSIFGGILVGIGLSLVIKGDSSAGGSTIIARLIAAKTEIKAGTVILTIDSIIIFSSLIIFEDRTKVLWSVISIYVTSKIIDTILTGRLNKKVVYLVTNKTEELKIRIREELGPKGTIIKGDPEGFLIITEATEMLGRGH